MLVTYYYYSVGESKITVSFEPPFLLRLSSTSAPEKEKKKITPRSEAVSNKRCSQPAEDEPALPGAPIREL